MGPVRNAKRKATLLLMPLSGWVKQSTLVYIVVKIIWPHWCERDGYIYMVITKIQTANFSGQLR